MVVNTEGWTEDCIAAMKGCLKINAACSLALLVKIIWALKYSYSRERISNLNSGFSK